MAGHYAIERELGMGGMATVFLARDLKHERSVALKVLRPELGAVLGIERFLSEIRVTAHLHHPHILPLFDSGNADGLVWYAMPYVEGESLRDRLNQEKQLSLAEAMSIATAVASALDYAHRHHVIHRDIKPENILLQDGQPVVADFGIALALSAAAGRRLTQTGISLGTPQYMSPEQATGERVVDRRTDIYSLGCVVYEMLAGDPPFTGSTAQSVLAQVMTDRPKRLSLLRETIPVHVEAALGRALAKVPADRFDNASDFAEALKKPGLVPLPADAGARALGRPEGSRVPGRWVVALLASGAAVGALGMWLGVGGIRQSREPAAPVARFSFDVGRLAQNQTNIAVSPNGSIIAYVGEDSNQTTQIFLRFLDRTEVTRVSGTEQATEPFFSPDSRRLGFRQDGKLKTVSVEGGEISTICDARGGLGAFWGPRNEIVFSAPWNGWPSLFRVSSSGGEPELLLSPDSITQSELQYFSPELLPDGRTVLFVRWTSFGPTLAALSLDDRRVTELPQRGWRPLYVDPGYVVFFDDGFKVRPFDVRRTRFTGPARPFVPGARSQVIGDRGTLHVSRTGTAAFLSGQSPGRDLVLVDRGGRTEVLPLKPDFYGNPRFSPDGRRILFTVAYARTNAFDLWIYDTHLRTSARLTVDSASFFPEWSPDGRRVIYARKAGSPPDWNLHSIHTDNSRPPELLLPRDKSQWQGNLTPDGRTLIFWEAGRGRLGDIWVTPVDTPQAARPLAITMGFESGIALSPDGRWLAYHSDESGRSEVYIRSIIGSGARYQVSRGGGQPRWGAAGRELFFRNGDSLYVVPITLGAELGIGSARALSGGRYVSPPALSAPVAYDARYDGQRFVFVRDHLDDRRRIEVVLNWFDQFSRGR